MPFELPELPYARDALAPHISEETLNYHYGKHHQAYVNNLNKLVEGTEFQNATLEDVVKQSSGGIFNNAAQIWNHTFYWHSMSPNGGGEPGSDVADALTENFGSVAEFKDEFTKAAATRFGSGWAWLVKNPDGSFDVLSTPNADTPLTTDATPLLTCDVWEHAYYIDTRNDRPKYISNFWNLVNWDFIAQNMTATSTTTSGA